jgi:hypothetical protein
LDFDLQKDTLAENKVLILYILSKIGRPVLHNELLDLVISISDMNYFLFEQNLLELLDDNYAEKQNQDDEEMIKMTEEGKEALKLAIDLLPGINKLKVDSRFKESYDMVQENNSYFAKYIKQEDGTYQIICKIVENSKTSFEIKLTTGTIEQAKKIVDGWNKNAVDIYPQILDLLT